MTDINQKKRTCKRFSEEDAILVQLVRDYGTNNWNEVSKNMLNRNSRQCKERWDNYLNPGINKQAFTPEEDKRLIDAVNIFGSQWAKINLLFPDRNFIQIRNRYNNHLKPSLDKSETKLEDHEVSRFHGCTCILQQIQPFPLPFQLPTYDNSQEQFDFFTVPAKQQSNTESLVLPPLLPTYDNSQEQRINLQQQSSNLNDAINDNDLTQVQHTNIGASVIRNDQYSPSLYD